MPVGCNRCWSCAAVQAPEENTKQEEKNSYTGAKRTHAFSSSQPCPGGASMRHQFTTQQSTNAPSHNRGRPLSKERIKQPKLASGKHTIRKKITHVQIERPLNEFSRHSILTWPINSLRRGNLKIMKMQKIKKQRLK